MTEKPFLTGDEVRLLVRVFAYSIREKYRPTVIMPVLRGAYRFGADMLSDFYAMGVDCAIRPIHCNRDPDGRAQVNESLFQLWQELKAEHVLVVDTIYDTGGTASIISHTLRDRCASLAFAFLFMRGHGEPELSQISFVGKHLGDEKGYLIGYGLDDAGKRRGQSAITIKEVEHVDKVGR